MMVHLKFGNSYLSVQSDGKITATATDPGQNETFIVEMPDGNVAPFPLQNGRAYMLKTLGLADVIFGWGTTGMVRANASPGVRLFNLFVPNHLVGADARPMPITVGISSNVSLPLQPAWLTLNNRVAECSVFLSAPGSNELFELVHSPCLNGLNINPVSFPASAAATGTSFQVTGTVTLEHSVPLGEIAVKLTARSNEAQITGLVEELRIPAGSTSGSFSFNLRLPRGVAAATLIVTAEKPGCNRKQVGVPVALATSVGIVVQRIDVSKGCGGDITLGTSQAVDFSTTESQLCRLMAFYVEGAGGCCQKNPVKWFAEHQGQGLVGKVDLDFVSGVIAQCKRIPTERGIASATGFAILPAGNWRLDPSRSEWTSSYSYTLELLGPIPQAGSLPLEKKRVVKEKRQKKKDTRK